MDEALFAVLVLGALGGATAYVARERGRNPVAWFFAGFFGGVIGLALVFILPPAQAQAPRTASAVVPPASVLQALPRPVTVAAVSGSAVAAPGQRAAPPSTASLVDASADADETVAPAVAVSSSDFATCPRCGRQVPGDAAFCPYCAAPVGMAPEVAARPQPAQSANPTPVTAAEPAAAARTHAAPAPEPEPTSSPTSQACPDCAEAIPAGAKHCPYCGYAMDTSGTVGS